MGGEAAPPLWGKAGGEKLLASPGRPCRKGANNVSKGCEQDLRTPEQGTLTGSVTRLLIATSGLDMRPF